MKIILAGLDIGALLEMENLTWQATAFLILGLVGVGAVVAMAWIKVVSMLLRLKRDFGDEARKVPKLS